MYTRDTKKKYLIYPESKLNSFWELFMTLVLLTTCIITPLNIAFHDENQQSGVFDDPVIDILFLIDIIIIFNSAFYNEDMELIEDRKKIGKAYLSGWFTVDFLAIVPFEIFFMGDNQHFNSLARVARFGRLYKLVKLMKLLRIMKIMKERNKLMK
jgi:hypothetical protein